MKRLVCLSVLLPVLLVSGVGMAAVPGLSGAVTRALDGPGGASTALSSIPPAMLRLYAAASSTCHGLSWTVLAAIGTVESANGTSDLPGVHSGHNQAGAEGPMQFEPATFYAFARPIPAGGAHPPSPYDPVDAVYAAARMLCADGAGDPSRLGAAVFDYNHSDAYVAQVLALSARLGQPAGPAVGQQAVDYALAQVGTPYEWGSEQPGSGFDCSGLAQAAWAAAGVQLPRVAQAQFDAGPLVPADDPLRPGDLVFFGAGPGDVTHVGLVVDPRGIMVDAPHSGSSVRVETFPLAVGAHWGADLYVGATAPGS